MIQHEYEVRARKGESTSRSNRGVTVVLGYCAWCSCNWRGPERGSHRAAEMDGTAHRVAEEQTR